MAGCAGRDYRHPGTRPTGRSRTRRRRLVLHHDGIRQRAWTRVVPETLRRFTGSLDALVNNAAMFIKTLVDTSAAELEQHFRVNQLGVFLGMQAVIEPLQATNGGSIVNISSVSAMRAIPGQFGLRRQPNMAVRGTTGNAAFELARLGSASTPSTWTLSRRR